MLARTAMLNLILHGTAPDPAFLAGLRAVVCDTGLDPAFRDLMVGWPGPSELASVLHEMGHVPDPDVIYEAGQKMADAVAATFADVAHDIYAANTVTDPYLPNADQSGRRALAGAMLSLISRSDGAALATQQFEAADNMTQQLRALGLVMDKWFGLQVGQSKPQDTVATVERLTAHPDFNWKNPNRFRAVMGTFAGHHAGFHHVSGRPSGADAGTGAAYSGHAGPQPRYNRNADKDRRSMTRPIALITGASAGIGAAAATLAAQRGYDVALNYNSDRAGAEAVAEAAHAAGARSVIIQADVSDPAAIEDMFAQLDAFGPLDALINNAGIVGQTARVTDLTFDRLRRMFDVNTIGAILVAQQAIKRMEPRGKGVIVNVTSGEYLCGLCRRQGRDGHLYQRSVGRSRRQWHPRHGRGPRPDRHGNPRQRRRSRPRQPSGQRRADAAHRFRP